MHKRTLASLHYENMPYDGVRFHILKRETRPYGVAEVGCRQPTTGAFSSGVGETDGAER